MKKQTVKDFLLSKGYVVDKTIKNKANNLDIYLFNRRIRAVHCKLEDFIEIYNPLGSGLVIYNIEAKRKGVF